MAQTLTARQIIPRLFLTQLRCGPEEVRSAVRQDMAADLGRDLVEAFPNAWEVSETSPIDGEEHTFSVVVMTHAEYAYLRDKVWRYDALSK